MSVVRDSLLQLRTELRFGLRDAHILGYTVWMPLFLYPILIFATFQVLAVREGRSAAQRFTVAVPPEAELPAGARGTPEAREALRRLKTMRRVSFVEVAGMPEDKEAREALLRSSGHDGMVSFRRKGAGLEVELAHRGVAAGEALVRRFEAAMERFRGSYASSVLRQAGVTVPSVSIEYVNVASSREMGEFILARLLPLTLVIFLGTGAFYTAIDVTAGERERGTLETTLLLPSSRMAIVLGKLLYVMAMAVLSSLVNFLSLSLTLGHAFALLAAGLEIRVSVPPATMALVLFALVVLASAICPLMMGLAFLTRSFREGQSYVGPVYAMLIAPIVLASLPGMELDYRMALVPMMNLKLGLKEVFEGKGITGPFLLAVGETLALGVLFVAMATRILSREETVLGGGDGASMLVALKRALGPRAA